MNPGIQRLLGLKAAGEKIACLTAYDATTAALLSSAGVDVLLVGDSLGMVVQGHDSTRPVTVADMVYHAGCVARGAPDSIRIVDLPYGSYPGSDQALNTAAALVENGHADLVKPEGAGVVVDIVASLVKAGYPVCGHVGLLPQSVESPDGYRVQGRDGDSAEKMLSDARALEDAGACMLVIECVPVELGRRISEALEIPTIGIGAGPGTDGQVLVTPDMLGMNCGRVPRFVKDFSVDAKDTRDAIERFIGDVKSGTFPAPEHCYSG